jgi:hypothetical protein
MPARPSPKLSSAFAPEGMRVTTNSSTIGGISSGGFAGTNCNTVPLGAVTSPGSPSVVSRRRRAGGASLPTSSRTVRPKPCSTAMRGWSAGTIVRTLNPTPIRKLIVAEIGSLHGNTTWADSTTCALMLRSLRPGPAADPRPTEGFWGWIVPPRRRSGQVLLGLDRPNGLLGRNRLQLRDGRRGSCTRKQLSAATRSNVAGRASGAGSFQRGFWGGIVSNSGTVGGVVARARTAVSAAPPGL